MQFRQLCSNVALQPYTPPSTKPNTFLALTSLPPYPHGLQGPTMTDHGQFDVSSLITIVCRPSGMSAHVMPRTKTRIVGMVVVSVFL